MVRRGSGAPCVARKSAAPAVQSLDVI